MTLEPNTIIMGGLLLVIVILIVWITRLEYRLKHLAAGKKAQSLEQVIMTLGEDVERTLVNWKKAEERFSTIENHIGKRISHVKTVRFNPFPDQGGNQSFATALVDDHGNGVVISSLFARDKVSIYSKPIAGRNSEYELTAEEIEALTP